MNLEESIMADLSAEIARDIDNEILWQFIVNEKTWHIVELPRLRDRYHAVDILTWLTDNCRDGYFRNGCKFAFKDSRDWMMFALRWSS